MSDENIVKNDSDEKNHKDIKPEEMNKQDTELLEKMDFYVDIFNVSLMYYHKLYKKSGNLFDNVDPNEEESTNKPLELFYENMTIYATNEKKDKKLIEIYDPENFDANKYDEVYGLFINNEIKKVSPTLFSLLIYLAELEWNEIDWTITKISQK